VVNSDPGSPQSDTPFSDSLKLVPLEVTFYLQAPSGDTPVDRASDWGSRFSIGAIVVFVNGC